MVEARGIGGEAAGLERGGGERELLALGGCLPAAAGEDGGGNLDEVGGGGEEFELTGFEVGGAEEALDEDEDVLGFGADEVEFVGVRLALAEGGAGGRQGGEYCRGARGCRGRRRR